MLSASFPLAEMKTGEQAVLHEIHADRGVRCRLSSLGFTPGVMVEMSRNYGFGPLVVIVRGTRVALGRQEARRATVRRSV
ncbi:MAG TPA: FeoA family protein [Anaerolineaceae bacterium]|nr:FeoA family protein [Anaerolineaceae bacterium]